MSSTQRNPAIASMRTRREWLIAADQAVREAEDRIRKISAGSAMALAEQVLLAGQLAAIRQR